MKIEIAIKDTFADLIEQHEQVLINFYDTYGDTFNYKELQSLNESLDFKVKILLVCVFRDAGIARRHQVDETPSFVLLKHKKKIAHFNEMPNKEMILPYFQVN